MQNYKYKTHVWKSMKMKPIYKLDSQKKKKETIETKKEFLKQNWIYEHNLTEKYFTLKLIKKQNKN